MVNIGIVGMGFMGTTHFQAAQRLTGARVAAIVTRDPKKKGGDWTGVGGNLGTGGGRQDLSGVKVYDTLDEVLADPSIDLIDICLPSHMHREAAIRSLEAGKHVLVEKPIALTLADADAMIAARDRTKKHLLVAHVLRFFPQFSYLKRLLEEEEYGALVALHLKRVISRPDWRASDREEDNGGIIVDLHVHDVDFIQYLCGQPNSIFASGVVEEGERVLYAASQFHYPGGPAVSAHSGAVAVAGIPFEHGYDAYFESASVSYSSYDNEVRLYTKDGPISSEWEREADGFSLQLQYAVDTLLGRADGSILAAETARYALQMCFMVEESVRTGKIVPFTKHQGVTHDAR